MARKSILSFVFDPDGSGCNIHIEGHPETVRFSFGRLGADIRRRYFEYGVKQKHSDVIAGDKKAGAKPADIHREIARSVQAAYNGQFSMRAAGQMFGDMVEAAYRIQHDQMVDKGLIIPGNLREECERRLLGMDANTREKWARKPQVAPVIAQVVADRLRDSVEAAGPVDEDLFDI